MNERSPEHYECTMTAPAEEIVQRTGALLRNQGIVATPIVKTGAPADVIIRLATEGDYDVTVVGAYGQNEGEGPGLGRISSHVLAYVPGAALIGRELASDTEAGLSILVAVDGSAASERAVRKLAELFDLELAEITLLFVKETNWMKLDPERPEWLDWSEQPRPSLDTEEQFQTELQREADAALERSRRILAGFGIGCHTLLREGNPAEEIVSEAEADEYDLIVLGAKGVTDLKHVMLGSVSAKVARHAPCSVAVVKAW